MAWGAQNNGTNVSGTSGVEKFQNGMGGVEGRRKVPEVLLFGDLRELAYKAIFKMP